MQPLKILLWFTVISMGCSSSMMIPDTLVSDAQTLAVAGRQGWLVNQKLSFGPYQSEKVKRGWTFSYDIPFLMHFQGAKEKLQFELKAGEHRANVFCLGKATQRDLPMLEDMFQLSLKDQNVFAGAIVTDYSSKPWEFLVQKNYNKLPNRDFLGSLQQEDQRINIREIQQTAEGKNTWGEPLGYEFVLDNEVIGAVEVLNKGRVILKNTTSAEMNLLLASTAAALLLRSDLHDTIGQ
ncbi:MAG: hypothetical protein RIG62_20490 [Cyclobacteriaceae bacterium]